MKRRLLRLIVVIASAWFSAGLAAQQLQVQLIMSPNPSPYLSDWEQRQETAIFRIINPSQQSFQVKVQTMIFLNNELKAETKTPEMPVITVGPAATMTLNAENIVPVQAVKVYGEGESAIVRSGKIPAGFYRICVRLLDAQNGQPLSQDACAFFTSTSYQLPTLLLPPNNSAIAPQESPRPIFTWTPLIPSTTTPPQYIVRVFEVLPGQYPIQAFRANRPILDVPVTGQTQLLWPPEISLPDAGQFVWSVQTLDAEGRPMADPDGYAEPFTFTVTSGGSTTVPCRASNCSVGPITVADAIGATPDGQTSFQHPLRFTAQVTSDCPSNCPTQIEYLWQVTLTTPEGERITASGGEEPFIWTPPSIGQIVVELRARVICGATPPLQCEGVSRYEGKVDGGSIVGTPDTLDLRNPSERPPFEPEIPVTDSIPTTTSCVREGPGSDPASPISLGMMLDRPDLFDYPRAVPIRADAIDEDYAIFKCIDCWGVTATLKKPVRDDVRAFKWKLTGKGSLNTPFDLDAITAIDDSIAAIAGRLEEIDARLETLKSDTAAMRAGLEKRQAEARKRLDELKKRITEIDSASMALKDSLKTAVDSLKALVKMRAEHVKEIDRKDDSTKAMRRSIDSLDMLLRSEPKPEELTKLDAIKAARDAAAKADSSVAAKAREIQSESDRLGAAISAAETALASAGDAYEKLKRGGEKETKKVADFQKLLYGHPKGHAYFTARRGWDLAMTSFINIYASGARNPLAGKQDDANKAAERALSAKKTADRLSHLAAFKGHMAALAASVSGSCSGIADPSVRSSCLGALSSLAGSSASYIRAVDSAVHSAYRLDPAIRDSISAARARLTALEGSIAAAARTVERRSAEYESAITALTTAIDRLERELTTLRDAAAADHESLAELERAYQEMVRLRESDLEEHRERYMSDRHDVESALNDLLIRVDELRDTVALIDRDTTRLHRDQERFDREIARLGEEGKNLLDIEKNLNAIIALTFEQLAADAIAEMEALKKEQEELRRDLDRLKKDRETIAEGTKEAAGAIVYYIPPPLEEIMNEEARRRFEALKDSVALAERRLESAKEFKGGLGGRLVRQLERIARELTKRKRAESEKEEIEKEKEEADKELKSAQNDKTLEYQDKQLKLQEFLERAEKYRDSADRYLDNVGRDKEQLARRMDELRAAIEQLETEIASSRDKLKDAQAQFDYEENLRRNAANTLQSRLAELGKLKEELLALEDDLARARNLYTRVVARGKARPESAVDAEARSLKSAVDAKKSAVTAQEGEVGSAAQSHASAEARAGAASETLVSKSAEYTAELQKLRPMQDSLVELNEMMEELLTGENYWKLVKEKAEEQIEKVNDARREFQDEVANLVNNDEEVKSVAERLADAENRLEEAEATIKKTAEEIADALGKRTELTRQANDSLDRAKAKLEESRTMLRSFLTEQFRTVTFKAELELKAEDEVIDRYRGNDPERTLTNMIAYEGDRTPRMSNIVPSSGLAQIRTPGTCVPEVTFKQPSDLAPVPPKLERPEPRTIALLYKRGEPLWPEWPVIPSGASVLTDDVVTLIADGTDSDILIHGCVSPPICPPPGPFSDAIRDVVTYEWSGDGAFINGTVHRTVLWKPAEVSKPDCKKEQLVKTKYRANAIAADPEPEKEMKPEIAPGVLIEVPDTLVGAPKHRDTVRVRVVKGDHKGRSGEEVEFSATLIEGASEGYGFGGASKTTTATTDGDGYARAPFDYGDGFAIFKIEVRWKRPDECKREVFYAISPLYLRMHRFATGAATIAWDAATDIWKGGSIDKTVAAMPDWEEEAYSGVVHAVAGYHDENRDSVNGVMIGFKAEGAFDVEPDSAETEMFGIARTVVNDPPEQREVRITATCTGDYRPVCRPDKAPGVYNSSKIEKFRIGSPDDPFIIVPDEPIARGEAVGGTGKLEISVGGIFIVSLKELTLNINEVVLDEGDDEIPTAVAGSISWRVGDENVETDLYGFKVSLDSIVVRAGSGAGIGGGLRHDKLGTTVKFYAEMNTAGEFYGEIASIPEISIAQFKLRKGTSFAVDMHSGRSDKGLADGFQGVVIRSASLELPPVFNGREGAPSALSVTNFVIGKDEGFAGTVALEGSFFTIGYAGYEFHADKLSVTFEQGSLAGGEFQGVIALPSPMEGKLRLKVGRAGDEWKAEVLTDNPVSLPRLQTTFSLRDGTGIVWDEAESIGTLRINAIITSTKFGEIDISGFELNSNGEIKADNIGVNKAISLGRFTLHLNSLSFVAMGGEYGLSLDGGFAIPAIGLDKLDGTVTIAPGPEVSVKLDEAKLSFENGPVQFEGSIAFNGNMFRGEFDIGLKNLAAKPGGIKGMFIVGSQPIDDENSYTFWYVEMSLGLSIPLGQTGLSLLELGGGVGWNYDPPVGTQEGSPRRTDALSFKAIVGVGNTPGGELFAGRLTMVLTPGAFTVNGKVWLLQNEESMFGEGQLGIHWDPVAKLDGYVRMVIGVPDAEGKVFSLNGKINFLYSSSDFFIRSEEISGSALKAVKAEASLDVTEERVRMEGRLWYDLNKTFSLGIVSAIVDLHVSATGILDYDAKLKTLYAEPTFKGSWDVNLDTPVGMFDIISGSVVIGARLRVSAGSAAFEGTASISYSVLWYSGSETVDVGYTASL